MTIMSSNTDNEHKRTPFSSVFKTKVFNQKCDSLAIYTRTSLARTRWDHEYMFETGVVRANEC